MKRDFAGAVLLEQDYQRLKEACRLPNAFPASYGDWLSLVNEGTELAKESGTPYFPIHVNVDKFLSWVRAAEIHPCLDAMRAFLIVQRHGVTALPGQPSGRLDGQG